MKLSGKVAIVTGGSQGIGRGIVDAFLAEGASVLTCGRSSQPKNLPDNCDYVSLDVADPDAVNRFSETQGFIDILLNNAGVQVELSLIHI